MDSLQKLIVSDNPFKRFPRNLSVKSTQVIKDFLSNREKTVQSSPKSQSSNEKPEAKPSSAEEDDVDLKPRESFESSHKLYESDHQVDFIGAFRKISTTSIPVENQNSTVIDGEVVSENLVTGLSPLEILDSEIRDLQNLYESLSISRLQKNEVRKKLAMKRAERNRIAASMQ